MSGGNRMAKRKNRIYRRIAMALTVALLAGQSHAFVLAEEGAGDLLQTEVSSEEIDTDAADSSSAADGDNPEHADDGQDQRDENNDDAGNEDIGDTDDKDTEDGKSPKDDQEGKDTLESGGEEAEVVLPESVSENVLEEEADISAQTDENVRAYAEGEEFIDGGIEYVIKCSNAGKEEVWVKSGTDARGDLIIPGTVTKDTISYRVTGINEGAFFEYYYITSIKIPESVTSIGKSAFQGCVFLRSVEILGNVTDIESYAFAECTGLTSVRLPGSMTSIEESTFESCISLGSIEIPESVTSIKKSAFDNCRNLRSVTIPGNVTDIGERAFFSCFNLISVTIPNSVKSIGESAFESCSSLTSVKIPDGMTSIEKRVFYLCRALTSVEIPDSMTDIGEYAFCQCSALTNVKIPDSVTSIGEAAFSYCTVLTSVKIPDGVTSIEKRVFYECRALINVELPDSVTSIGQEAFAECHSLPGIELPDGVTSIGQEAFTYCISLSGIELPDSVTSIGQEAFTYCISLSGITIPGNVTGIERETFAGCSSLASVTISENIGKIDYGAFRDCEKLRELRIVVLSDGKFQFPEVGEYAFYGLPAPDDREDIVFVDDKGDKLTEETLKAADVENVFKEASKNDNDPADNPDDGKWYGWSYKVSAAVKDTYKVIVNTQKDGQPWQADCNKKFAISNDNGSTFIDNLGAVEAGNYTLYDVTDANNKMKIDGVTVTVTDADVSATVDYYTVTFCDYDAGTGEQAYGADTDWRAQTVLKKAGRAVKPAVDPEKAGYIFDEWVTTPDGDEAFAFGTTEITAPTRIYAKWTENTIPAVTYTVTINVKKDGEEWNDHGRSFALLKNDGSFITVPGQASGSTYRINQVLDGTYRIYDVTGVSADSLYSRTRDTGIDVRVSGVDTTVGVTVKDGPAEEEINYYTITFYDGKDAAYGEDTDQRPQTVLKNQKAVKPTDPDKTGYQFAGWKTEADGTIPYVFEEEISNTTDIFASWNKIAEDQEWFRIAASAGEGGKISPEGAVLVAEGGEQTFTITPDEGNRIKAVTVDNNRDVTAELSDSIARQTGAKSYTFTNVTVNHSIHAIFERDGNTPGGDEGDNTRPGGGDGNNANPGNGSGSDDNINAGVAAVFVSGEGEEGTSAGTFGRTTKETEPKTGDTLHMEVYATVAMIAGLTYLLLYFMEESHGMTEREKDVFMAALIRWGKKGGTFRRRCAMVAIFCLLVYYHVIGKRVGKNALHLFRV